MITSDNATEAFPIHANVRETRGLGATCTPRTGIIIGRHRDQICVLWDDDIQVRATQCVDWMTHPYLDLFHGDELAALVQPMNGAPELSALSLSRRADPAWMAAAKDAAEYHRAHYLA